jgi:hypothetical protein
MGKDPKQALAARQRVRGTSPLTLRSTMGVSRNLSRALRVPSGWPAATLDRTRLTGVSRWPSRRMRFASRASGAALSGFAADQVPDAVSHRDGQRAEEELPQARAQHRTSGQPRPERELLA